MNYKELLKETSSGVYEKGMDWYVDTYCPHHLFKEAPVDRCHKDADYDDCHKCWEREVPDEIVKATWEEITKPAEVKIRSTEPNEIVNLVTQMNEMDQETVERVAETFDKSGGYIVSPKELKEALVCAAKHPEETPVGMIEDSGDRTEFPSGAVRDMRVGKGRFDISPLEVISDMLGTKEQTHDPVILDIATFMYEQDTGWLFAALENFAIRAYNGCLPSMLLDVAVHFEEGAKKYGDANYKKGIPAWCYIDSAVRHYLKWLRGDTNEHHNRAFVWNLMCCIWEVDYGEEWREEHKKET